MISSIRSARPNKPSLMAILCMSSKRGRSTRKWLGESCFPLLQGNEELVARLIGYGIGLSFVALGVWFVCAYALFPYWDRETRERFAIEGRARDCVAHAHQAWIGGKCVALPAQPHRPGLMEEEGKQ